MRAINDASGWWGPPGRAPSPLSITALIEAKTLSPELTALLWTLLEGGASLIVAAGPRSAGKTTLLTALLSLLPPSTIAYYTQGFGESFADLPSRQADDPPTFILINEISDHLSTYLWGPPVQRAFSLLREGYALAGTMHANHAEECLWQLHYGCGVPADDLTRCDLILTMTAEPGRRRIAQLFALAPGAPIVPLAWWDRSHDAYVVLESEDARRRAAAVIGAAPHAFAAEIQRRATWLTALTVTGANSPDDIAAAIDAFHSATEDSAERQ
ncbi:MAG: hypothetical protein OXG19_09505 [Chloroflexi bacterium]|nr:hypothetical protein [Chloroflexota bacterium]